MTMPAVPELLSGEMECCAECVTDRQAVARDPRAEIILHTIYHREHPDVPRKSRSMKLR